jgi:hypothetical protein
MQPVQQATEVARGGNATLMLGVEPPERDHMIGELDRLLDLGRLGAGEAALGQPERKPNRSGRSIPCGLRSDLHDDAGAAGEREEVHIVGVIAQGHRAGEVETGAAASDIEHCRENEVRHIPIVGRGDVRRDSR